MPRRRRQKPEPEGSSESSSDESSYTSSDLSGSGDSDNDSRVFCKCGQPNTVDMIGCDRKTCQYEWLHFECVGIDPKNVPKGKWVCEDCTKKEDEEDHRIPSGPFVYPVANSTKQNDSNTEAESIVPRDLYILPTPANNKIGNSIKKAADIDTTSSPCVLSVPDSNANDRNFLTDVEKNSTDTTMKRSLNQAEKQLESNIKEACIWVIHNGMNVVDAAKQFGVGRYMLGDCVKDQLKVNLNKACEAVINGRLTFDKAAAVYGIIPGILNDRVRAEMDSDKWPNKQPLYTSEFEEDLQQACIDVRSDRSTIDEASKDYNIKPETLKNELQAGFILSTAEENDLVTMSVRMAVLGHSAHIKSTVFAKVKALLDEEEAHGTKRVHWFAGNTPNDMWWDVFCSRHPEFKAISLSNSSPSGLGSSTIPKQPAGQTSNHSSDANKVGLDQTNHMNTPQRAQSATENVFYIMPKQVNSTPQFVLVRQENPPVSQKSNADDVRHSGGDCRQNEGLDTENRVMDLSLKTANVDSRLVNTGEIGDPNLAVAATEIVQDAIIVQPSTEAEEPSLVVSANEVVQPTSGDENMDTGTGSGDNGSGPLNQTVTEEFSQSSLNASQEMVESVPTGKQPDTATADVTVHDGMVIGANEVVQLEEVTRKHEDIHADEVVVQPNMSLAASDSGPASLADNSNQGKTSRRILHANQVGQPGQIIYKTDVMQPNKLVSNNQIIHQKLLISPSDGTFIQGGLGIGAKKVVKQSQLAVKNEYPQSRILVNALAGLQRNTYGTQTKYVLSDGTAFIQQRQSVPSSPAVKSYTIVKHSNSSPATNSKPEVILADDNSKMSENNSNSSHLESKETRTFVAKYKVDQTLPDALTCLEKTLTKEQKDSFMFRLKIGDNRRDDLLYNAWKALKRMYYHTDICSLYSKVASDDSQVQEYLDTPTASKLLELPLMEPYDANGSVEKAREGPTDREDISHFLGELRQGRKRRRIVSVLARREAKRMRQETKRKAFLEPWKHKMERPSRRKSCIPRHCGDGLVLPEVLSEVSKTNPSPEMETENPNYVDSLS